MSKRLNRDDIDKFLEYSVHPASRTLYMGSISDAQGEESGTDYAMAEVMIKGLHILDSVSDAPITIIMNNLGGEEYHGLAIYDAIKGCRSRVTVRATGHAMSMGSWIFQAADHRVMTPNARLMIHYGTWGVHDHPKIAYKWMEECKRIDRLMEDTYLQRIQEKHPEFTRQRLQKMLNFDTILTAQETVELGLADEVLG
jgi:ATP-dependent Clp protease protease subunit